MFQYSRLVRLPGANAPHADERRSLRLAPFNAALALALCLAGAVSLVASGPVRAESDVIDGVGTPTDLAGRGGMPASNPRVAGILAAHPNQFVVICVAGCTGNGRPQAVQILPKPTVTRRGEVVPSSADMSKSTYGPPAPTSVAKSESDDVVCLAGCAGKPGQVVQRVSGLPPPQRTTVRKKPVEEPAAKPAPKTKSDGSIWDDLIP